MKTLKDINLLEQTSPLLMKNKEILRKEVIKRIKYYNNVFLTMNTDNVIVLEGYYWTHGRISGAISAWMLFFNIEEDDLK